MNTGEADVLAVIGVGLIGGSIGLAALQRGVSRRVIGIGRSEQKLREALACGAVTETTTNVAEGVRDADLVVVCSPVETIPQFVAQAAAACRPGTLITDAGSTKQMIVERVAELRSDAVDANRWHGEFLGSHPLAGSEKTGVAHSRTDLLENRVVVLTPTDST
ncbi:MAG: prephenate dehydrogenase/arogenate dehydrogenase family protein, partial [Planctomycetales bacterium]|nr:prephenate dehydrogenase/arogenate dehydrogenase family protein [Planctomycetales bacterium]